MLEGDVKPMRQVTLEFADMAALKAFYNSPAYQRLVLVRQGATRGGHLLAIEGV